MMFGFWEELAYVFISCFIHQLNQPQLFLKIDTKYNIFYAIF